jgi:hypothetical protein
VEAQHREVARQGERRAGDVSSARRRERADCGEDAGRNAAAGRIEHDSVRPLLGKGGAKQVLDAGGAKVDGGAGEPRGGGPVGDGARDRLDRGGARSDAGAREGNRQRARPGVEIVQVRSRSAAREVGRQERQELLGCTRVGLEKGAGRELERRAGEALEESLVPGERHGVAGERARRGAAAGAAQPDASDERGGRERGRDRRERRAGRGGYQRHVRLPLRV